MLGKAFCCRLPRKDLYKSSPRGMESSSRYWSQSPKAALPAPASALQCPQQLVLGVTTEAGTETKEVWAAACPCCCWLGRRTKQCTSCTSAGQWGTGHSRAAERGLLRFSTSCGEGFAADWALFFQSQGDTVPHLLGHQPMVLPLPRPRPCAHHWQDSKLHSLCPVRQKCRLHSQGLELSVTSPPTQSSTVFCQPLVSFCAKLQPRPQCLTPFVTRLHSSTAESQ